MTTITKIPSERARAHAVQIDMEPGYQGRFKNCPHVKIDCVVGDTDVLTDEGWKSIYSLAADWESGDPLTINYIIDGKAYKGSTPFYKGVRKVWKISLDNGLHLSATAKHRIAINRKGHHLWVYMKDLNIGDRVVTSNNVSILDTVVKDTEFKEAYFAGFWYGDGSYRNTCVPQLQVPKSKKGVINRFIDLDILDNCRRYEKTDDLVHVTFNSRATEILARLEFSPDNRHRIPDKILNNQKLLFGFLSGLMDSDGTINNSGIRISGTNNLHKLHLALIRFGATDISYKVDELKGTKTNFGSRNYDLCSLVFRSGAINTIRNNLWLVRLNPPEVDMPPKHYSKIILKSYAGRQHVYDIYVEKVHRFIANSVVVHNCDCMRHLFVWNFALLKKDAAILDHTNGEPPVITNPEEIPGCCVDENAWVYTRGGSKRLKDIEVGDEVRTMEGLRSVVETVDMGLKASLEIELESGRRIKCTKDHKILNLSNNIKWKQADHIKVGSWLITSKHNTKHNHINLDDIELSSASRVINPKRIPKILNTDVAEFLGMFVAEGSATVNCLKDTHASISQYEPITKSRIISLCNKIWCRPVDNPMSLGADIARFLNQWGVSFGSFEQTIPDIILESSNDILRAFLKGYYAGDGWFSENGRLSTAGTRSKRLRDDLLYALLRLGIPARSTKNWSGARPDLTMYLVRTSDPISTSSMLKQFRPDRHFNTPYAEESDSIYAGRSIRNLIPFDPLDNILRKFAKEWAELAEGSNDLIPALDLQKIVGFDAWTKLKCAKLISQVSRDGIGGKNQHFSTLNDALYVTLEDRANAFYNKHLKIRHHGDMCVRRKVIAMLNALPIKYRDDLKQRIAVFLREDIFFERVKVIRNIGSIRVRDIGVENTPHFFANGILVSNCKHGQVAIRYLLRTNPIFNPPVNPGKTDKNVVHLTNLDTTLKRLRKGKV